MLQLSGLEKGLFAETGAVLVGRREQPVWKGSYEALLKNMP